MEPALISGLTRLALLVAEQLNASREAAYYAEQDDRREQAKAAPAAAFAGLFGPAAGVYVPGTSAERQLLHHATEAGVDGQS
ncbi:hypothetical protein ACTG10_23655 [Aeromonas hydrophila]|uniref:hypothetical protein n=1 Tax=Aeromonas TaxID=642 RepID=UPI002B45BAC3|nr:hypothetical protein [Aeromonas caviae]